MKEILETIFRRKQRQHQRYIGNSKGEYNSLSTRPLEGAGRSGWDSQQNTAYGRVYGNSAGPSTNTTRGEVKHFSGKGPKNYRRSDDRICDDINDSLTDDRFLDATEIEVTVKNGEVTLTGLVADHSSKRRAEDLAESVPGVNHLENRLRIIR